MISFYAVSKTDGVDIDHFFNAKTWNDAKSFADKMGYKLVGQEQSIDEMLIELTTVNPRLH
ncbi:MAG: hypothetical protein QQN63_12330 [Nitrosopumilus sp.]